MSKLKFDTIVKHTVGFKVTLNLKENKYRFGMGWCSYKDWKPEGTLKCWIVSFKKHDWISVEDCGKVWKTLWQLTIMGVSVGFAMEQPMYKY